MHFACMKSSNAEKLAQIAGKLVKIDEEEEEIYLTRKYLHFRAEIDVHKSLTPDCLIPRRHANSSTSKL